MVSGSSVFFGLNMRFHITIANLFIVRIFSWYWCAFSTRSPSLYVPCILVMPSNFTLQIVGKPGSSKSLAMELLSSNLNGKASESPFFRDLPAIEVRSQLQLISAAYPTWANCCRHVLAIMILIENLGFQLSVLTVIWFTRNWANFPTRN